MKRMSLFNTTEVLGITGFSLRMHDLSPFKRSSNLSCSDNFLKFTGYLSTVNPYIYSLSMKEKGLWTYLDELVLGVKLLAAVLPVAVGLHEVRLPLLGDMPRGMGTLAQGPVLPIIALITLIHRWGRQRQCQGQYDYSSQ